MFKRGLKLVLVIFVSAIMAFGCVNVDVYASSTDVKKVTISSVTAGNKKFTVKYKKVSNASGYQISYKKSSASKWTSKNVSSSKTSYTVSSLKAGTKYNVKVRAYVVVDGETYYGSYSTTKSVTVLTARQVLEQKIVALAKSKLGCKYKYGSSGPNTFDCSGFTSYVMKKAANIKIPRTSSSQHTGGKIVSIKNLKVGDIVWRSGHVGLYVGNGKVIHSPQTGDVVRYTSASKFKCGVRYF